MPVVPAATGQTTQTTRETSTPYTGDLSHFDYPERGKKLQVNRVMDLLGIKAGSSVADIGAGGGWFTMLAANRVGPSGTVYAEDINPEAMDYIRNRAQHEHLGNVREVLGKPDNAELPASSVDAVLLLKSYHEVAEPVTLLRNLRASLRNNARVGIIDRNGNGADHGINKDVVIKEAGEAGYKLVGTYDFVKPDKVDYFLVFQPE
ncbi:MAG TPA: methyltransferase domain-containing protein [Terriglobales bacterium]|nr:methyltransferase domain-containing protein [Terriglobales bacterium]